MTHRLFTAVELPETLRNTLDDFLEPRREAGAELRWTVPQSWHLTLSFMPKVDQHAIPALIDNLELVTQRSRTFPVTVAGAGVFPHPDAARVFWLGVTRGEDELAQLARRCRNAANRSSIAVEGGRFDPHLTLARAAGISGKRWLEVFASIDAMSWTVGSFALIRSQMLPGGAGYQTLAEFALTD